MLGLTFDPPPPGAFGAPIGMSVMPSILYFNKRPNVCMLNDIPQQIAADLNLNTIFPPEVIDIASFCGVSMLVPIVCVTLSIF
jgi:hypothetical protein